MREDAPVSLLPPAADPKTVMSPDGVPLATYDLGDPEWPAVLAVHGFASSAYTNWIATGWVRELNRAGYRVVALDQRGHGNSGKPQDPAAYTMALLVADVQRVLDTYLLDEAVFVGYSLGARVGWHAALGGTHVITRAVLGGIPDGDPLTRFRVDEAKAYLATGEPVEDLLTQAYITMASGIPGNDLAALVALVEGMRGGEQPDPVNPPQQPVLFAAGSEDRILAASERLAASAPRGEFFLIPGRNHFNAPTARAFRTRALEFLTSTARVRAPQPTAPEQPAPPPSPAPPPPPAPRTGLGRSVAGIVFDEAGRLLVLDRPGGGDSALTLPGGAPRAGESDAAALERLCREQLGAEVVVGDVAWVGYEHVPAPGVARRASVAAATGEGIGEGVTRIALGADLARLRPPELIGFLLEWGVALSEDAAGLR